MSPQTVIGTRSQQGWRPTAQFLAQWRVHPALQPQLVFADDKGRATAMFRAIWRPAKATTLSPVETIVTEDGKPTPYFLRAFG